MLLPVRELEAVLVAVPVKRSDFDPVGVTVLLAVPLEDAEGRKVLDPVGDTELVADAVLLTVLEAVAVALRDKKVTVDEPLEVVVVVAVFVAVAEEERLRAEPLEVAVTVACSLLGRRGIGAPPAPRTTAAAGSGASPALRAAALKRS